MVLMRNLLFLTAIILMTKTAKAQLNINYQKNKGSKAKIDLSYQYPGVNVYKNNFGRTRISIGPFDSNNQNFQRKPASTTIYNGKPFYQAPTPTTIGPSPVFQKKIIR